MLTNYHSLKVESESDRFLTTVLHFDQSELIRQNSDVARVLYDSNRKLFERLKAGVHYHHGNVYQYEVYDVTNHKNSLGVNTMKRLKSNKKTILSFSFDRNRLKHMQRFDFGRGRQWDVNTRKIKPIRKLGILSSENVSLEDIRNSNKIASIREVNLFRKDGIRTFILNDHVARKNDVRLVEYEIELFFSTNHEAYVDHIIKKLSNSILFITNYIQFIDTGRYYDYKKDEFVDTYKNKILGALGLSKSFNKYTITREDHNRLYSSDFGKSINSFVNGQELLGRVSRKAFTKKLLLDLIPVKTSPEKMRKVLKKFIDLYSSLDKRFNFSGRASSTKKMIINNKEVVRKSVILSMKNPYRVTSIDKISYNLMINKKFNDLHVVMPQDISRRMREELRKFSPGAAGRIGFIPFLTPVGLNTAERTIPVYEGVIGVDPEDVKNFRLARVVQHRKNLSNKFERIFYFDKNYLANPVGKFNLAIADPALSNMQLKVDGTEDDYIDAKEYVGADSYFIVDIPRLLKRRDIVKLKRQQTRNLNLLREILPQRFLRKKGEIKNLAELDPSNPQSRIFRLNTNIEFKVPDLPPQIQAMTTKRPGGSIEYVDIDMLRNKHTRPIVEETQKNVHELQILSGFSTNAITGRPMLNNPIWRRIDPQDIRQRKISLVRSVPWTEPIFGFFGSKHLPPINNNLMILNGNRASQDDMTSPTLKEKRFSRILDTSSQQQQADNIETQEINSLTDLSSKYIRSNVITQNKDKSPLLKILKNIPLKTQEAEQKVPMDTQVKMTPTSGNGNGGGNGNGNGGGTGAMNGAAGTGGSNGGGSGGY